LNSRSPFPYGVGFGWGHPQRRAITRVCPYKGIPGAGVVFSDDSGQNS
jgi:hypothetical protein